MTVDIRLCAAGEIDRLTSFLGRHWASDHIFLKSRKLLDWQHRRQDGDYNFVIATRRGDAELLGVLGFIPTTHFDPQLADNPTVWLALWKVRPDAGMAGLGLALLRELSLLPEARTIAVNGIVDDRLAALYRALGYSTGELRQYYLPNPRLPQFQIARFGARGPNFREASRGATLSPVSRETLAGMGTRTFGHGMTIPAKTPRYFHNRFLAHPIYQYAVYRVQGDDGGEGLLATRVATVGSARVVRIVDFWGEEATLKRIGAAVAQLVDEENAEYADIWNFGYSPETFSQAGFNAVDPDGPDVIPNFFEPFVQRTGRIRLAIKAPTDRIPAVFRADGDQDRPNSVGQGQS